NHDIVLSTPKPGRFQKFFDNARFDLLIKDEEARKTFVEGGYYSILFSTTVGHTLRFIVLNTNQFLPHMMQYFEVDDGKKQMDWFNKTIADADRNNEKVLLLLHVPPGINEDLLYRFLDLHYEQLLLSIIENYSHRIILCLAGHRHQDMFRVYKNKFVILGQPSLSPINSLTHPSIRHFSYDRYQLTINDYSQYALNLDNAFKSNIAHWQLMYTFSSWFNTKASSISINVLSKLVKLIKNDDEYYVKKFLLAKYHARQINASSHFLSVQICALTHLSFDEFLICIHKRKQNSKINYQISFSYSRDKNVYQEFDKENKLINRLFRWWYKIFYT
ncbi:unnamed protein product, partial [Didymodactylos carnosus]